MDAYATHQEYTKKELESLKGKKIVLELGVGNGSSPLMYNFCKNNPKARVISFETEQSWFNSMFEKYGEQENYVFNLIENWDDLSNHLPKGTYDLVFVDQAPWAARIDSINLLKDRTKTFILHDYDYYNQNQEVPCNNIYINDETSWLGQNYSNEFILEDNFEILPPTLVMRKK